jgi:hypothetical protein
LDGTWSQDWRTHQEHAEQQRTEPAARPGASSILAIMANVDNVNALRELGEVQAAAGAFGLEATTSEIRRAEDIIPAFEAVLHPFCYLWP